MEVIGICRNLFLKIWETTSSELIFGFKTTVGSLGLYQGQKKSARTGQGRGFIFNKRFDGQWFHIPFVRLFCGVEQKHILGFSLLMPMPSSGTSLLNQSANRIQIFATISFDRNTALPSRKGGVKSALYICKRATLYINLMQAPHFRLAGWDLGSPCV